MSSIRSGALAALAAAAVLSLGACSSSSTPAAPQPDDSGLEDLIAAAQEEGQLTLYGDGGEPTLQAWTQQFTEQYGITVNILRLSQSELFQRFSQEKAAGQNLVDIYSTADRVSMTEAVDSDWIEEYTPENADLWPEERSEPGYFYPLQNGYFMAVAYNPTMLDEDELEMVRDDPMAACGDPAFRDRCAVGAPQAAQHAAAFWYANVQEDDWDTVQAIADNSPYINTQALTILQGLTAGEYAVGIAITDSLAAPQVLQGAPIEFAYPVVTTGGYFNTGIVADSPHPSAAKLFMEWATTAEVNSAYSDITQTIPVNTEVDDQRQIIDTDWYREPDVDEVWFDWIADDEFLQASGPEGDFLAEWSERFGFNG